MNTIGDEGAKAIASALEPHKNPDGTWAINQALNKLNLACESCSPLFPTSRSSLLFAQQHDEWQRCPGAAGNIIGDEGAKALASALEPRKNPDGTWAFNQALKELNLYSETCSPPSPSCWRSITTDRTSLAQLQTTRLKMREPRPSLLLWSPAITLMAPGRSMGRLRS